MDPDLLKRPETWGNHVGELGRGLILLALALFIVSLLTAIFSKEKSSRLTFVIGCGSLFGAFASLGVLLVKHQFQFAYVYEHSDRSTPIQYLIAGLWAGQEGSFLLWAVTASIFGLLTFRGAKAYQRPYIAIYSTFLAALSGILAYESPFNIALVNNQFAPPDGKGLVPSLFNYWITIHPPTIFMGFGSLTVIFAYAMSALLTGDYQSWVRQIRPWVLVTTALMGIGLCMGGFWAYETLGWGGFWMWDPVENTSFVPWVWSVALVHGLYLQVARNRWIWTNLFIAGTSMISFVYGTFLTRSGFLKDQSVHSFAEMNRTALWVLVGILAVGTLGFLSLWIRALRSARLSEDRPSAPDFLLSRDNALTSVTWLMLGFGIAAAVGMSLPLFQALRGQTPKVVDEASYHRVLLPLFLVTLPAMAVGPFLSWRGQPWRVVMNKVVPALTLTGFAMTAMIIWLKFMMPGAVRPEPDAHLNLFGSVKFPLVLGILMLLALCLFVLSSSVILIIENAKKRQESLGGLITHFGVALALAGLIVSRGFERKEQVVVQPGRPTFALGYMLSLKDAHPKGLAVRDHAIDLEFRGLNNETFLASPTLYYIPSNNPDKPEPQAIVRPSIVRRPLYDVYVQSYPMSFEAGDPLTLKEGQSQTIDGVKVTYKGFHREGEAGMLGTKFIADLELTNLDGKVEQVSPSLQITAEGPQKSLGEARDFSIEMVRMDAASKDVVVQLYYRQPLFPLDVLFKPFTWLVWAGAGIMTAGGLLAARARRPRTAPVTVPTETEIETDATLPTA